MAESSSHRVEPPSDISTCACCWDDIDSSNYVEYKSSETSGWFSSHYCSMCIDHLLKSQWHVYVNALEKTTCKAEQRRLLSKGPTINIKDQKALPCPDDGEVYILWYLSDNQEHSAKLEGSLIGDERQKYWDEQSAFYIADEKDDVTPAVDGNTSTDNTATITYEAK